MAFVRAVFTQRRKTMRNAIANTTHISGIADVDRLLASIDPDTLDRRPGELPPEEFAEIANEAVEMTTEAHSEHS